MPQQIDIPGQGIIEFPDGMSDEDIVSAIHSNFGATPIGAGEDIAKSLAGGIERGIAAVPMVLPNLLNQAVAGPQYLYEGLIGKDRKDFQPWQPFYSSEDVLQSLPESLRPHEAQTVGGVGADMVGQLVGNIAGGKGIQKSPQALEAVKPLLRNEASGSQLPPKPKINYDPIDTHTAIGSSYASAKKQATEMYGFLKDIGEGHVVKAKGLKTGLDDMIADIENSTVPHEGAITLNKLKQIRDGIGDDGSLPLNTAVDLKQYLNGNFNPKRFSQDGPYAVVSRLTENTLNKAAKQLPDFGDAKRLADKNWVNTVDNPFQKNTILQKFWKPEDYYNKLSVDNGIADALPDPTLSRANSMLSKVRTPDELNAITRVLPEEMASTFRVAKAEEMKTRLGGGRLSSLGKAALGAPNLTLTGMKNTLTNLGEAIGGPNYTPEQKLLLKATKSPGEQLPLSDYEQRFQELKDYAGKPKMSVLGPKQLPAPPERLALPAPENIIAGGRSKQPRILTPQERDASILLNQQASELGLTPDVLKAQQIAKISEYEKSNPANQFFNKIGKGKFRVNQTALDPESVGYETNPFYPEEFSQGGRVKKNLSAEFLARKKRA